MSRRVGVVLLCEDAQHEVFARRFLGSMGWSLRELRLVVAPPGRGSAEQFVRERYAVELTVYRREQSRAARCLIVVIDGDNKGPQRRLAEFEQAGAALDPPVPPRQLDEKVAVFVPTWEIETWFAFLDGQEVDETRSDYPKLRRERECKPLVETLVQMCRAAKSLRRLPPSLDAACGEYRDRLADR